MQSLDKNEIRNNTPSDEMKFNNEKLNDSKAADAAPAKPGSCRQYINRRQRRHRKNAGQ